MNVLQHLREWSASEKEWSDYVDLAERYDSMPAEDLRFARTRMAILLDSYANRMERSALVRVHTTYGPDELRADAAEYRAGRDPLADSQEAT